NATTNNDADRIGLSMRGLLGVLEARAYTRLADGPINNLDKVCVTDCQIRDAAPRGFEPMVTPSTIGATSGPLLRDASLAAEVGRGAVSGARSLRSSCRGAPARRRGSPGPGRRRSGRGAGNERRAGGGACRG